MPSSSKRGKTPEDLLDVLWRLRAAWLQNRNAWQPVMVDVDEALDGYKPNLPQQGIGGPYLTWGDRAE